MVFGWFFRVALLAGVLFAGICLEAAKPTTHEQQKLAPYLLPLDHSIKPILDAIFTQTRVTLNLDTLFEAGFAKTKPRKFTKLLVTKHPAVPGYIFKIYLDAQRYYKNIPEHHFWLMRVRGAHLVRNLIQANGWEGQFKVPQKWLYALPKNHLPPQGYETKYYILVEEDMDLLSDSENKAHWASNAVTHDLLNQVHVLLKTIGLSDCPKPDNIPFSKDGRIAFIDTQTYGESSIAYKRLAPFLSKSNQDYWKTLTRE